MKKLTKKFLSLSSLLLATILVLAGCQPMEAPAAADIPQAETAKPAEQVPHLTNPRQNLQDGMVVIDQVYMDQRGWVAIHAAEDGQPGPVIGYIEVPEGVSTEVFIQVSPDETTPTLYAMLHMDSEPHSEFNFPEGEDDPVSVDGEVVVKTFDAVSDYNLDSGGGE